MRYFAVSDVHSFYNELINALNRNNFNVEDQSHILIVCGDLFDRGNQSKECFEFVKKLQSQNRLIYVKGNHETLLKECVKELSISNRAPGSHHFHNGTVKTICDMCGENEWVVYDPSAKRTIAEKMQHILDFIDQNCVNYFELPKAIFVHGWIPLFSSVEDWRVDASEEDWEEARWWNGMEMWRNPNMRVPGKNIICGHWHCSYGHSIIDQEVKEFPQQNQIEKMKLAFKPWIKEGIIAIDSCCAYSKKINCVVFDEEGNLIGDNN